MTTEINSLNNCYIILHVIIVNKYTVSEDILTLWVCVHNLSAVL